MTARLPSIACLFLLPFAAAGCGKDCQSTCNKLYGANDCGSAFDGAPKGLLGVETREEKMSECMDACENALQVPGKLGDYDPYTQKNPDDEPKPELENDRQAALWMECVSEYDCPSLKQGYCLPVW